VVNENLSYSAGMETCDIESCGWCQPWFLCCPNMKLKRQHYMKLRMKGWKLFS